MYHYTRVPAHHLVPKPSNLKHTEATGLGTAGLTAYQALFDYANLEPGQNVFINGGGTSVSMFAIQIAKALGCTIMATVSTTKEELLRPLGVDRVSASSCPTGGVDYTNGPVHEKLERDPPVPRFHPTPEAAGSTDVPLYTRSEAYLVSSGVFVSVGPVALRAGVAGVLEFVSYFTRDCEAKDLRGYK